jgi:hypothetical protein
VTFDGIWLVIFRAADSTPDFAVPYLYIKLFITNYERIQAVAWGELHELLALLYISSSILILESSFLIKCTAVINSILFNLI